MPPGQLDSHQVFKGHMLFGLHELLTAPADYITFLRDPVNRMISLYRMLCRKKIMPSDLVIDPTRSDWNLGECPDFREALDNGQTRALAGIGPEIPFGSLSEKQFQPAPENKEVHFKSVWLTEQFDLSLRLLGRVCGWKWHFYVPDNVAHGDSFELSPAVVEAVRDLNRFDFELYRHAHERFQRLVDDYGWRLKVEQKAFRLGNRVHQQLHVWRHRIKRHLGTERRKAMIPAVVPES